MAELTLTIHAEIDGEEKVQVYEGDAPEDAIAFLSNLPEMNRLTCQFAATAASGEHRTLNRSANTKAGAKALIEDANSWIAELDPNYKNDPIELKNENEGEEFIIAPSDVAKLNISDLTK